MRGEQHEPFDRDATSHQAHKPVVYFLNVHLHGSECGPVWQLSGTKDALIKLEDVLEHITALTWIWGFPTLNYIGMQKGTFLPCKVAVVVEPLKELQRIERVSRDTIVRWVEKSHYLGFFF